MTSSPQSSLPKDLILPPQYRILEKYYFKSEPRCPGENPFEGPSFPRPGEWLLADSLGSHDMRVSIAYKT